MPSPFPGMDPYLEDPGLWPDVHHELISVARELLQDRLSPKYIVRVEERVYVSGPDDEARLQRIPDVQVLVSPKHSAGRLKKAPAPASVAVLERPRPIELKLEPAEVHEARLNIISREDRFIVAVIEVLSPANKAHGAAGRENYLQKREEVLASHSHLIEIDLLRAGESVFSRDELPPHDYAVRVSKYITGSDRRAWAWPIVLQCPLPEIFIPLRAGDADALLDLQAALGLVYKRASYELELDYSKPPVPPLQGEQAAWSAQIVASGGQS
jgi:hypothetical protein